MKIIAFTGKKQSGKDSSANFLIRNLEEFFPGHSVQRYAFADPLKEFCRDYLGIPGELLWGTDEQKNTLTNIKWEAMPHYLSVVKNYEVAPTGAMTVREVMQQVGTEWFRNLNPTIWCNLLEKKLKTNWNPTGLALITDMRFPNEAELIQSLGGKVIRLTRTVPPVSMHLSETALDNYDKFDLVINNQYFKEAVKNKVLLDYLMSIGWVNC